MKTMKRPIYLDYQATTPVDARVFEVMKHYFMEDFGNPGSSTHDYGDKANEAVDKARDLIAACINAQPSEIIFVSGATEANNLAIQGITSALKRNGKTHILSSLIEHKAVLEVLANLEKQGFDITLLSPDEKGFISIADVEAGIRPTTGLMSFMHANNEIGVINNISNIGALARRNNIIFHCDAAQSLGKLPIDVEAMNIDLLSMSAHKIYGPKGVGALYKRKKIRLEPLLFGGGQESGLRAGTPAVPLIAGFGEAVRIAAEEIKSEQVRLLELRDRLLEGLKERIPELSVNGDLQNRLAGNLNVALPGIDSDALMNNLRNSIAVSNGSACASIAPLPSHVLKAIGASDAQARNSIRIGIGRYTTATEIDFSIQEIAVAVKRIQTLLSNP